MKSYPECVIYGVCFRVRRDKGHNAPNPGLRMYLRNEDKVIELFGLATNVIELVYKLEHRVVLFSCEWLNTNPKENLIQNEDNLVNICVSSKWYGDDPFVLANEATQVFYVDDQKWRPSWRLNESSKNSATVAPMLENIFDGEHERITIVSQHSTPISSTTSSPEEMRKEQPNELVGTIETKLESERAWTLRQKAELESRRALSQVQKAELESQCNTRNFCMKLTQGCVMAGLKLHPKFIKLTRYAFGVWMP
ncbi:hypothetical protein MKX01_004253 [Papaver californicum]|nr:hypothetical protein MKX01_004253 [Papaver californicum]